MKKVILKGTVPVDQYVNGAASFKVYEQGGKTYAATLNQSNIQNNNNKFYILQILQSESNPNNLVFFTRWGRVGVPGQQAAIPCMNSMAAIHEYNKKLRDKLNGGYREVAMNYEADEKQEKKEQKKQAVKKK